MSQNNSKKDPRLISYNTLRITIGWLGILLPLAMIAGNFLFGQCHFLQDSNSHYYYTITGNLFTGILCAVALFLIAYKGFDNDHIFTSLAGLFALGVAMFPTNDTSTDGCAIVHLPPNELRNIVHYSSAALFFITLAYISLFLFTKSKGYKTKQKEKRNKVYVVCGAVILIAITSIALFTLFGKDDILDNYNLTFWLEWVALIAFGLSWLVKGELILEDKHPKGNS